MYHLTVPIGTLPVFLPVRESTITYHSLLLGSFKLGIMYLHMHTCRLTVEIEPKVNRLVTVAVACQGINELWSRQVPGFGSTPAM